MRMKATGWYISQHSTVAMELQEQSNKWFSSMHETWNNINTAFWTIKGVEMNKNNKRSLSINQQPPD